MSHHSQHHFIIQYISLRCTTVNEFYRMIRMGVASNVSRFDISFLSSSKGHCYDSIFCLSEMTKLEMKIGSIICSLGEEPVKLFIEVPRQRFWLTFTFLLKAICGFIIKIPLIRTKISLLWDLN